MLSLVIKYHATQIADEFQNGTSNIVKVLEKTSKKVARKNKLPVWIVESMLKESLRPILQPHTTDKKFERAY